MTSQVSERGQITIDRTAREQLGVRPGMIAYQRVVDGHLEVLFLPAPHRRSLYGAFHKQGEQTRIHAGDDLEEAVMEGLAEDYERTGDNGAR
jgi:bifunctional DNA-binding transcriptional regulator/antitoxin component of YhaV-PrlF toxin-antitoxin module